MFIEYLSRKRDSLKAWVGKLLMPVVTVMLLVGMTMAGNVWAASSCDVVKNGLVACYPFDGNANDVSTNGNHGIEHGITYVDGVHGKAAEFSEGDYVDLGQMAYLSKTSFSISLWVKKYVAGQMFGYIGKWNSIPLLDNSFGLIEAYGNDHPGFCVQTGDDLAKCFSSSVKLEKDRFAHIVAIWDNSSGMKMYMDGQLVLSNDFGVGKTLKNETYSYTAKAGSWGVLRGGQYSFKGLLDDLRIYNRALTEEEIKKLYQLKDSPPKTCEHAIYSVTNNIGKLVIPFVEIPLLNLYTQQPTGELAVFSGELKQVGSSMDFGLVSSKLKLIFLTTATDPCHAVYDETQKTLHAPFVDVGNEVYDVKFQHLKDIPLELGMFHLESIDLVE